MIGPIAMLGDPEQYGRTGRAARLWRFSRRQPPYAALHRIAELGCGRPKLARIRQHARLLAGAIGVPQAEIAEWGEAAVLHMAGYCGVAAGDEQGAAALALRLLAGEEGRSAALARIMAAGIGERWDGAGPSGLLGIAIPLPARLATVVRAFERAVVASGAPPLSQEPGTAPDHLLAVLRQQSHSMLDPLLVAMFGRALRGDIPRFPGSRDASPASAGWRSWYRRVSRRVGERWIDASRWAVPNG